MLFLFASSLGFSQISDEDYKSLLEKSPFNQMYPKFMAKAAGVSDDEIKAAIQVAAEVARFSTLLYGNEFGQQKLKNILGVE